MAEAAGKASAVSLSHFLEISDLEIETDPACMATLLWAGAVWMGRRDEDLENCWRRQACETASWKQVRGPAGGRSVKPEIWESDSRVGMHFPLKKA